MKIGKFEVGILNLFLVFVPIAFVLHYSHADATWIFIISGLAIIPLAGILGEATEHLSEHVGPGVGGLLNATFGNAAELIIAIFALQAGLYGVVKASITGSIIGNLLLVLGASMLAGGVKYKTQSFSAMAAGMNSTMLILSTAGLLVPAVFYYLLTSHNVAADQVTTLDLDVSLYVAVILFVTYILSLIFSLQTHKNLFDTFVESSWYYARYCSADCTTAMLDERARYWLPVDQYVGGIEHAVLHLLYARFFHKLMRDEGLVDCDEPFARLLTQGMVVAETYYREDADGRKHWYNPAEVEVERDDKGRLVSVALTADGQPVIYGGIEKMSKSKNNGIDPQALTDRYGADTVRLYTMFTSPPDQSLEWNDEGVDGSYRFLKRLWTLAVNNAEALRSAGAPVDLDATSESARRDIHGALKKALFDYERQQFNTVVSGCMTMVNVLYKLGDSAAALAVLREGISIVLRLLAPIAPHATHHLWRELGYGPDILSSVWPVVDEAALKQDSIDYVVQVNGKVRGKVQVPAGSDKEAVERAALAHENVGRFIGEAKVRKVIVVPNKLVNVVAK